MTLFTPIRHSLLSAVLALLPAVVFAAPQTYNVRTGDTLDQVIRQTMGTSPLKVELLRQAFIDQNPKAFTKTSPRYLMAGSVLTVPNHDELMRQHLNAGKPATPLIDERKNWVRYP
jgi:Tfp pilus assembly protein FimV